MKAIGILGIFIAIGMGVFLLGTGVMDPWDETVPVEKFRMGPFEVRNWQYHHIDPGTDQLVWEIGGARATAQGKEYFVPLTVQTYTLEEPYLRYFRIDNNGTRSSFVFRARTGTAIFNDQTKRTKVVLQNDVRCRENDLKLDAEQLTLVFHPKRKTTPRFSTMEAIGNVEVDLSFIDSDIPPKMTQPNPGNGKPKPLIDKKTVGKLHMEGHTVTAKISNGTITQATTGAEPSTFIQINYDEFEGTKENLGFRKKRLECTGKTARYDPSHGKIVIKGDGAHPVKIRQITGMVDTQTTDRFELTIHKVPGESP